MKEKNINATGKFDSKGKEIMLGDKIRRIYDYEIRLNENNQFYAHILDGSKWHLGINVISWDFTIIERNGKEV